MVLITNNCNFILGSRNPKSDPTILEALYYKQFKFQCLVMEVKTYILLII